MIDIQYLKLLRRQKTKDKGQRTKDKKYPLQSFGLKHVNLSSRSHILRPPGKVETLS